MSQENATGSKQNRRRESILKTQLFEAEDFKDKQKRRVSFRNVKEVQIYNTDKNCPDLLHSSPPKKEKINDTLGSDGVFTPGRTTLSEISNHSPKNNTMSIFNATAQNQPESSASKEPSPKFVIEDDVTPPVLGMDRTSHTALDMSVSSDTSKMDDTLQMFTKSFVQAPADSSTLNTTIEMFGNTLRQADTTPISHDDTLTMFKSPSAGNRKHISMSSTMAIFQEEINSPNDTMKMFGDVVDAGKQNSTMQMFGNTSLPSVSEEVPQLVVNKHDVNKTLAMDISMGDETMEVTKQLEGSSLASPSIYKVNKTLDIFGEAMDIEGRDQTIVENAEVSCVETEQEKCRVGPSLHMSILQNNTTMHLTNEVEDAVVAKQDMSSKNLNASTVKSPAPVRKPNMDVLGQTMDIFTSSQEYQNATMGGRKSELEFARRVNVGELLNFSEVSIQLEKTVLHDKAATAQEHTHLVEMSVEKTLLFDKTDTTSEATQLFDKSMDVSMNKTANLTAKALSQSLKGRRRSLNTTLQNVVDSPILTPNSDLTMEEQLSFTMRNSLFDDHCAQLSYLLRKEGGLMAHTLRQKAIAQLEASVESSTAQSKTSLSTLLVKLKQKNTKQAAAVEAMNGRNLGPVDRDIILAARYEAEAEWFKTRTSVADGLKRELESLTTKLADKLEDVEQKALLCENRPVLEAEVAQLENELAMLASHNGDSAVAAEERHLQLLGELEKVERMQTQAKLKILEVELEFSKRKVEEQKKLAMLLSAAKREKDENSQLLLQMIRNALRQETEDTPNRTQLQDC